MPLKCIIIDDDSLCLQLLKRYCQKTPELEVVGVFSSAKLAIEHFTPDIDLIFLDIEMPEMTGMEFLDQLPTVPNFIFTTTNPTYALDAFQYGAIDYLVKPVPFLRFKQAVEKAIQIIKPSIPDPVPGPATQSNEYFFVKEKGQLIRLTIEEILYFENIKDYVLICTKTGKHIIYSTLKSVLAKLPTEHFMKVHRTYIVNFSKIENIEENSLVIGRKMIPISKAHKSQVMNRLRVF